MKIIRKVPDKIDPQELYARLATWFGCGYLNPAPGTWGTLGAIPLGVLIFAIGGKVALLIGIVLVSIIGLWAADKFDKAVDGHDSKMIVIDEVAGMWIAMIPAALNPLHIFFAFVLFRFFDILKPWPISFLDRNIKGASGVMLDDIVAGYFACLCLMLIGLYI